MALDSIVIDVQQYQLNVDTMIDPNAAITLMEKNTSMDSMF